MTDAAFGITPGTFDPSPPPRLLWALAFVAVVAVHVGVAAYLLDRPMDVSANEAPEAITLIDLPPAPPAPGDSALQLPASEELNAAPASAPDAAATSVAPDETREVSEAAAVADPSEEPPPETVPEPPPLTAPSPMLEIPPTLEPPPPLAAPQPMLEIPPTLEPPPAPVEPPPEPPVEEAPVVPEATVVLPSVIPPPMERPEPPKEAAPAPARREPAKTVEKPKPQQRQKAPVREKAAERTAGAPAADKTVSGKPRSGAAPRASGGGSDTNLLRRYQAQVRADIEKQSRSLSIGQRGRVVVRFTFGRDGGVAGVSVAKSSGNARLDQAAVQSVRRASPLPAVPEGVSGARLTWALSIVFD